MGTPKIAEIQVCALEPPPPSEPGTPSRREGWHRTFRQATPFDRFDEPVHRREPGGLIWVKAIADDGTWGLGSTDTGDTARIIIRDSLAPAIIGQEVGAIEACNDRMWTSTLSFGSEGLTARAVAGVDLALWDLWGKLVDQPVYRLAGGPARRSMDVYLTGNDVDWGLELGFRKFKLARPHSLWDGWAGIEGTVALIAEKRDIIGPEADLMLDCWMAYDVDYAVHMCEALRPYRMRWMEEMLVPHDWKGLASLRQRIPWQTLATGEHWSTRWPSLRAIEERLLDLVQADIHWVGGFTEAMKIAQAAHAAGLPMCLHTGANDLYGQHWTAAMPNTPLIEYIQFSDPGVPFEECYLGTPSESGQRCYRTTPGTPLPKDGKLGLPPGPGFGLQVPEEWLRPLD
ncbi:enolase C-terminal domain-like protein [Candidatus Latescibacterota bacterium]